MKWRERISIWENRTFIHTFPEISIPISSRTWLTISWLSSSSSEPSKMSSSVSLTWGEKRKQKLLSSRFQVGLIFLGPSNVIYTVQIKSMNRWRKVNTLGSLHLRRTEEKKKKKQILINGRVNDYKSFKRKRWHPSGRKKYLRWSLKDT